MARIVRQYARKVNEEVGEDLTLNSASAKQEAFSIWFKERDAQFKELFVDPLTGLEAAEAGIDFAQ